MEFDSVVITNFEDDEIFVIIFYNNHDKIASFELDIDEITKLYNYTEFNKMTIGNKKNLLKNFIQDLMVKKNSLINFIMTNGVRCIKVLDGFIEFKITCMTISCEFRVKINELLINEFYQKIFCKL